MCFCIFLPDRAKRSITFQLKSSHEFIPSQSKKAKTKDFARAWIEAPFFSSFPDDSLLLIMHKPIHVWIKSQCLSHTGAQHHLPGGFLSPKSSSNDATSMGLSPRLPPRNPKLRSKTRSASCEPDLPVQNLARTRKCTKRQPFVRSHHGRTF